jgi:hypothetical protein
MKYLTQLIYKKCWDDLEIRRYIRKYLLNDDIEVEKLIKILDELAAVCIGEADDLPPPP